MSTVKVENFSKKLSISCVISGWWRNLKCGVKMRKNSPKELVFVDNGGEDVL